MSTRWERIRARFGHIGHQARDGARGLWRHREVVYLLAFLGAAGSVDLLLTRVFGVERGLSVTEVPTGLVRLGYAALLAAGAAHLVWVGRHRAFGAGARCCYVLAGLVGSALLAGADQDRDLTVPRWSWFIIGGALALAARLGAQRLARRPLPAPLIVLADSGVILDEPLPDLPLAPGGRSDSLELGGIAAAALVVAGLLTGIVASTPIVVDRSETVLVNVSLPPVTAPEPAVVKGEQEDAPPVDLGACATFLWGQGPEATSGAAATFRDTAAGGSFQCPDGDAERHDNITVQFEDGHERGLAYEHVRGKVAVIERDFENAVRVRSGGRFEPQKLLGADWFEWFEHFQFGDLDLWVAYDRKPTALIKAVFVRVLPGEGAPPPYALLTGTRLTWWYAEARAGRVHIPDDLDHRPVPGDPTMVVMSFDGADQDFRTEEPEGTLYPTAEDLKLALG